jgi:farnesol kinase
VWNIFHVAQGLIHESVIRTAQMADIVGRRFGKSNKWPFSRNKSVAGSLAFAAASTLTSIGLMAWMSYTGCLTLPLPLSELVPGIAAISVACAGVELLPIGDDNWTVPLSAAILSLVFLH